MKQHGTAIRVFVIALLLAGCGSGSDSNKNDCGANVKCGSVCCGAGEQCKDGVCAAACVPNCTTATGAKECGDDGCGGSCGQCPSGESCSAVFACEGTVTQGNDDCAQALALQFDDDTGTALAYGDTTNATQNVTVSCAQKSGYDVVYTFTLARRQKLTALIQPMGDSNLWPAISVRPTCSDNSSDLACGKALAQGEETTLVIGNLTAGTYFVWVAGNTAGLQGAGRFRLTVTVAEPDEPAPDNDTCANATAIIFQNGHAEVTGNTQWADNNSTGAEACPTPMNGGDVVYRIDLDEPSGLMAAITSVSPSAFTPALYIGSSCSALADHGCGANAKLEQYFRLPAGSYYLVVDSRSGIAGTFTLSLTLGAAPANDTCATPQDLALEPDNNVTVTGTTTFAGPDSQGQGDCAGTGHDLVYSFTISEEKTVAFTVTPAIGSTFAPIVYVRSTCDGSTGNDLACGKGAAMTPARTRVLRLPAGQYFVWVGSPNPASYGSFTLNVTATPIVLPANDLCATPETLNLDEAGNATISASTLFAVNDYQGSTCAGQVSTTGADLVYKVVLGQDSALRATVTRDGPLSAIQPAIYVRTDCTSGGSEKTCGIADPAGGSKSATVSLPVLTAGDYFIVIDGLNGTTGEFTLQVSTGAPVLNDTCASPEEIAIDTATGIGTVTADTSRANGDAVASCQGPGTTSADVVYKLVLDADKSVLLEVTPEVGSQLMPAIFVRTDCADPASEMLDGCMMSRFVLPTALSFTVLPQGTYYIWIDGRASAGAFTLTVTTQDAPARPDGDLCDTVQPLALTATETDPNVLKATVTGDLTTARNDSHGLGYCENARAPDMVYSFSLSQAQKVVAKLDPDLYATGYQPVVYIRSACAATSDGAQLACAASLQPGQGVQAVIHSLAQGDYFVWVDGVTNGRFSLEVTVSPADSGPTNDNCSAPASLVFVGDTATAAGTTVAAANDSRSSQSAFAGAGGGDVVYTFTTGQARKITAVATAGAGAPPTFKPVVIIRDHCGPITSELAWDAPTGSSQTATATVPNAPAGTYFIWVDSGGTAPAAAGAFDLNVTLSAP